MKESVTTHDFKIPCLFPKIKYIQSHWRSALSDEHLQSILIMGEH